MQTTAAMRWPCNPLRMILYGRTRFPFKTGGLVVVVAPFEEKSLLGILLCETSGEKPLTVKREKRAHHTSEVLWWQRDPIIVVVASISKSGCGNS